MAARLQRILDVGQCGFDGPRLRRMLKEELGAEVDSAETGAEALAKARAERYDLVLVNRVLNADRSSGLAVIEELLAEQPELRVMLVSDREEAQAEAEELGALPGFGKGALGDPETVELLRGALEG